MDPRAPTSNQTTPVRRRARRLAGLLVGVLAVMVPGAWLARQWADQDAARADRAAALDAAARGRFAEAEPHLVAALERDPADRDVVKALAVGKMSADTPLTDAVPYLSRWAELESENPQPLKLRLRIWGQLKDLGRAIPDAFRLLELEPGDLEVRKTVVYLLLHSERFEEARRHCQAGKALAPGDPEWGYLLAKGYHLEGQPDKAAAAIDEVLRTHPGFPPAQLLRGTLYAEAEQPDRAVPLLRAAVPATTGEDRQAARYHLAQALARLGRMEEAAAVLAEFERERTADRLVTDSEAQPHNVSLLLKAAAAVDEVGNEEQAYRLLQQALGRAPDVPDVHLALAGFYDRHGRPDLAAAHRQRAAAGTGRERR